jgi:hypothetical protein
MADVIEQGFCAICGKPINLSSPETIDYNGQRVHRECVPEDGARTDRNQSYT